MSIILDRDGVTIHNGDCIEVLRTIPDESVQCCVTSPPYWGLRDYGHDGQIGLEATPEAYVGRMVEVYGWWASEGVSPKNFEKNPLKM